MYVIPSFLLSNSLQFSILMTKCTAVSVSYEVGKNACMRQIAGGKALVDPSSLTQDAEVKAVYSPSHLLSTTSSVRGTTQLNPNRRHLEDIMRVYSASNLTPSNQYEQGQLFFT